MKVTGAPRCIRALAFPAAPERPERADCGISGGVAQWLHEVEEKPMEFRIRLTASGTLSDLCQAVRAVVVVVVVIVVLVLQATGRLPVGVLVR
ncbi:hypothetical protein [Actinosynnema sp. NPDC023587]|uniref:hypothetical protein n=1 Tax=Actinosynnema sp. NPDC023587 TaxID=3154695 RepID=UPI0033E1F283